MRGEFNVEPLVIALMEALTPRSLRERAVWRLSGGLTVAQVVDRLAPEVREGLEGGEGNPVVARRRVTDVVGATLRALARTGEVQRRSAGLRMDLGGKGARNVEVDLFRRS